MPRPPTAAIGIEIANIGAVEPKEARLLDEWYMKDSQGHVRLTIPDRLGDGGIRTPGFVGRPARREPIAGKIQGQELLQYDFTPEQYRALIKLTATLCKVFPKITCDYPRDDGARLLTSKLPDQQLKDYQGLLGHYHIQTNKVDPGPAFQWEYVVHNSRELLKQEKPAPMGHGRMRFR